MTMFVRIHKSTIDVLEYAADQLGQQRQSQLFRQRYRHMYYDFRNGLVDLDKLRNFVIALDRTAEDNESNHDKQIPLLENEGDNWLVCEEDLEIIPLYKEAISLSALRYIIEPAQIQNLLRFVGIPTTKNGMDVENHQFGYHFHYGKIKSGELIRTNVLLTFNPNATDDVDSNQKPPLYSEYHGEGHSKHIDVDTIGLNKRKPIYLVCYDEATKRGIKNFKRLKKEAHVFYPLQD